jgi:hypothetical protein
MHVRRTKARGLPVFFALQQHGRLVIRGSKGAAREIVEGGVEAFLLGESIVFMIKKQAVQKDALGQSKRFIEAARAAGCSEDETVFDENLKQIVKVKSQNASDKSTRQGTK